MDLTLKSVIFFVVYSAVALEFEETLNELMCGFEYKYNCLN